MSSDNFDPSSIANLDGAAWERWLAYRVSIRKPIKPASMHAAALKLSRYGDDQDAVVEQSVANGYQGLFDLKKSKPAPGEKPQKSREQIAAETARHEFHDSQSERFWREFTQDPIGDLRMMDAVLARITINRYDEAYTERMSAFREKLAEKIAAADATKVYGDPHLRSMVMQIWGDRGINRLKARIEKGL
jgi:hypothetical protein